MDVKLKYSAQSNGNWYINEISGCVKYNNLFKTTEKNIFATNRKFQVALTY